MANSQMPLQGCKADPMTKGGGLDNDCDGQIDEESCDGGGNQMADRM